MRWRRQRSDGTVTPVASRQSPSPSGLLVAPATWATTSAPTGQTLSVTSQRALTELLAVGAEAREQAEELTMRSAGRGARRASCRILDAAAPRRGALSWPAPSSTTIKSGGRGTENCAGSSHAPMTNGLLVIAQSSSSDTRQEPRQDGPTMFGSREPELSRTRSRTARRTRRGHDVAASPYLALVPGEQRLCTLRSDIGPPH